MTPWSGFTIPPGFLADGCKAPLPLPRETAASYRRALLELIEGTGVPRGAAEAGLSTAAALLEGAQEILVLANALLKEGTPLAALKETIRQLLLEIGALLKQRNSAYAIHQIAGLMTSSGCAAVAPTQLPRIGRLKDFMTPLEKAFERIEVPRVLEAENLGQLLVRLDEFYDDAALQLQRLFQLASVDVEQARALAPDMLRRIYTEFATGSFADHLLAEHEKGKEPGQGTGLRDLLPALGRALESL